MRELARVLRPGGVFIARTISRHSVLAAAARVVPNDPMPAPSSACSRAGKSATCSGPRTG